MERPTKKQLALEDFYHRPWRDALRWCLLQRGMTQQQIADELRERNVSRSSIGAWWARMQGEGSARGPLDGTSNGHAAPMPDSAAHCPVEATA